MPDDSTISISDIEAARAAMTGGNWVVDIDRLDQANIFVENQPDGCPTDWIAILPHQCVKSIEANQASNAIGICALHAASPTLIAVVKAALEHERTRIAFETSSRIHDRPVFEGHCARMQQAHRDLLSALAKVTP